MSDTTAQKASLEEQFAERIARCVKEHISFAGCPPDAEWLAVELRAYRKAVLLNLSSRYEESQTVPGGIKGWLEHLAGEE